MAEGQRAQAVRSAEEQLSQKAFFSCIFCLPFLTAADQTGCESAVGCKTSEKSRQEEKDCKKIRMGRDHSGGMGERAKWRK